MQRSSKKTAEQYSASQDEETGKKKPGKEFNFWFGVVRFLTTLFDLVDRHWERICDFFHSIFD